MRPAQSYIEFENISGKAWSLVVPAQQETISLAPSSTYRLPTHTKTIPRRVSLTFRGNELVVAFPQQPEKALNDTVHELVLINRNTKVLSFYVEPWCNPHQVSAESAMTLRYLPEEVAGKQILNLSLTDEELVLYARGYEDPAHKDWW